MPDNQDIFRKNIVINANASTVIFNIRADLKQMKEIDHNCYYSPHFTPSWERSELTLEEYQEANQVELNSIVADPLCVDPENRDFVRGDANADGSVDIGDPLRVLQYQFRDADSLGCVRTADVDDDGQVNLTDAVVLLGFLFLGADHPPDPFRRCDQDETPDGLSCEVFPPCSP